MSEERNILKVLIGTIIGIILATGGSIAYAVGAFPVATGGTGSTTLSTNQVLLGNGTSPVKSSIQGTNGQYFVYLNGIPTWTTGSSTAAGTVTSIATTFPVQGGPITTTGTLTFGGLSTTSPFTIGGLAAIGQDQRLLYSISTSTLSGSGVVSVTAGAFTLGSNPITISCPTCSTTSGTVTSITGGTGLNGGAITTSGTLALKSYLATSTADTANQISVFTSTNATPATFGGFTNFTFNSTTNLFTVINASTTNITASQSAFIASKQVNPYQNATFAYGATSTAWTGTTTETQLVAPFAGTLQDVVCVTSAGTLNVQAKVNSTAVTPMFNASTTKGTVTYTANNTFVRGDTLEFDFGTPASSPTSITCTPRTTVTTF